MARLWKIDPVAPEAAILARAAAEIVAGRLVAFPTETVYGLGGHALDTEAVRRIYQAKGRPAANPLIVHVPHEAAAAALASHWPDEAHRLATRYWPGPLSIVVPRRAIVPELVTAGGATVALRVPAHPVALGLLRAAAVPIAAPSANRSLEVSPTTARHVVDSLDDEVDLVLDAGPTAAGIESTVVDLTRRPLRILRPGPITPGELSACLEEEVLLAGPLPEGETARSPGQQARHYAPRARLEIVAADRLAPRADALLSRGASIGIVTTEATRPLSLADPNRIHAVRLSAVATEFGAGLYAALRALDEAGVDVILVAEPPATEAWLAIRDRLARASSSG